MSKENIENSYIFGRGFTDPNAVFTWNPDAKETVNPHIIISGLSGAGKSTLLRDIVRYLQSINKNIYLIDLQGDMEIEGENYIEFTAWNSKYGINPFEFDTGLQKKRLEQIINGQKMSSLEKSIILNSGPIVQAKEIIDILKKNFLNNMGQTQENILKWLIMDTYQYAQIKYNDFTTWLNPLPSFSETKIIITEIQKIWGILNKVLQEDKIRKPNIEVLENYYQNYFANNILEKKSIDVLKYLCDDNIKTMKKLDFYITSLIDSYVFHSNPPSVRPGVNRLDISGLRIEIQRFISDVLIGKIFRACKIRGEYAKIPTKNRGAKCDTFIILDEARLVVPNGKERNNPFAYANRIVAEARKYGLGLIVAVQSPSHLPDEFLRNIYTQVVLNINESDYNNAKKIFDLTDKELLKHTKFFGIALIKKKYSFQSVKLNCFNEKQEAAVFRQD